MATIAQLMNYRAPYLGNFLRSLMLLEEEVKKAGDEVVYIFMAKNSNQKWLDEFVVPGRTIYFLSGSILNDVFTLRKILNIHHVDIIHLHFSTKALFLVNLALRLSKRKIFVIRHLHNMYARKSNIVESLRGVLAPCDVTLACGKHVAEQYTIHKKSKKEAVDYLTNGIDFSRFKQEHKTLKKEDEPTSFLLFGYDIQCKGVDLIIKAFDAMHKKGYEFKLTISVAVERENVKQFVEDELGEMPTWLNLIDGVDDIEPYYREADFFVSASRSEGLCYSLVEAVYCGAQIIISNIGGHLEWGIPNAIVFETENLEDLKLKLEKTFSLSRADLRKTNEAQRKFVAANYAAEQWAGKMGELYKTYIAG